MSKSLSGKRLNNTLYVCRTCRARLESNTPRRSAEQRRWLSRNYIINLKTAEREWVDRAEHIEAGNKKSILDVLEERGYVNQIVGKRDDLNHLLIHRRVGVYAGFDPTAPSLHVGHMIPFMVLAWFYIHGYAANFLLGGTTAKFGDPTGRLKARDEVSSATAKANMASMHVQLKNKGALLEKYAENRGYRKEWAWRRALINNNQWWSNTTFSEFMRVMGLGIRIGPMLGRDTVKNRMEKGDGMSFAEFSYPLMQAWDWWELYQKGVQIQVGGADQFGNILAGAEAVKMIAKTNAIKFAGDGKTRQPLDAAGLVSTRREKELNVSNDPMGFTVPLLTTAAGEKFGKSAGNAVWLDKDLTSSFDLYQFFLRSADADVERYLKLFTFLPLSEIGQIMEEQRKDESKRVAQHRLAREFVELVHGLGAAEKAEEEHKSVFNRNPSLKNIQESATKQSHIQSQAQKDDPSVGILAINPAVNKYAPQTSATNAQSVHITLPASLVRGRPLARVLWTCGLVVSRAEGQRLITANGVHIGGKKGESEEMSDELSFRRAGDANLSATDSVDRFIIDGELLVLRVGKWKHRFIKIVEDEVFEAQGGSCPGWKDGKPEGEHAGRGLSYQEETRVAQRAAEARRERDAARWKSKNSARSVS